MGVLGLEFFFSVFLITSTTLVLSTLLIFFNPVLVQKVQNIYESKDVLSLNESNKDTINTSTTTTTHPNSLDDSLPENEFLDHHSSTTEDSEVLDEDEHQWPYRNDINNIDKRQQWIISPASTAVFPDDGSISDEESLIEISLPSGHYVEHRHNHKEAHDDHDYRNKDLQPLMFNLHNQQKKNNNNIMAKDHDQLFPDSFSNLFKQHSLMELLAEINEMNEEENLIEIDISMGSIKCSRFEIQA
ncbi:hypothetical protein TorRG33x02_161630 [Trema orientale]|uniref:Transmembrane protein n=1 Tax=Trema orientale TaxID=63057 RepID=A0A2P5EQY0_TREOI|nr:hypothetical protein TorRG33x02_161630 [Trema orientale]